MGGTSALLCFAGRSPTDASLWANSHYKFMKIIDEFGSHAFSSSQPSRKETATSGSVRCSAQTNPSLASSSFICFPYSSPSPSLMWGNGVSEDPEWCSLTLIVLSFYGPHLSQSSEYSIIRPGWKEDSDAGTTRETSSHTICSQIYFSNTQISSDMITSSFEPHCR